MHLIAFKKEITDMTLKILTDRALLINKMLVIADLHIGLETDIYRSGIAIPSQIKNIGKRIKKLIKQTKAEHLIILGDLKHQVPGITKQELREIPLFLDKLSKDIKITIVKGNHDAGLENMTNIEISPSSGLKISDYGFVHGHSMFSDELLSCKYIIMAHVHPAIEFKANMKEPCWIRCTPKNNEIEQKLKKPSKIKEIVIMPSFNQIISGVAFNSSGFKPLGPVMKLANWKSGKVYLLDGTYLGELDKIIQQS